MEELSKLKKMYAQKNQQDANEFFMLLIGSIKTNIPNGITENPVNKTFEWNMIEIRTCKQYKLYSLLLLCLFKLFFHFSCRCGFIEDQPQLTTSICLPIAEKSTTLEECLDDYTMEEERPIKCTKCEATVMLVKPRFRKLPKSVDYNLPIIIYPFYIPID